MNYFKIIGLIIGFLITHASLASVITLGNNCSLSNAIISANANTAVSQCVAGDDIGGSDSIILVADIVLTQFAENDASFGRTGTPGVTSNIIIEGNGFTLERDASLTCNLNSTDEVGEFRLLRVSNAGNLDVRNIVLINGCADSSGGADKKIGGAILNFGATLILSNSVIVNNGAELRGGGVDTTFGTSTVVNSYFKGNQTNFGGAGLSNFTSTSNISDSTFHNNIAGNRGGGVFNVDGASASDKNSTMILLNNTFSSNTSNQKGGAIYNDNAQINNSHFNTLSDNTSPDVGSAIYNSATGLVDVSHFLFNNNTNTTFECINDGGDFFSTLGLTDSTLGGCASVESSSINLLPLANNGCMTPIADGTCVKTHRIDSNSSAISNTFSDLTDFDQRGFVVIDGKRDTGAYQFISPQEQCGPNQLGISTGPSNGSFIASVNNEFELSQAIICANMDDTTTDTIGLNNNINLSHQISKNSGQGANGTPVINSHIVIGGNDFTLQRDLNFICAIDFVDDRTEFRIFEVSPLGQLDLKQISLRNGCADTAGVSYGGAVYNLGTLSLDDTSIKDSQSRAGGGLANGGTVLSIENSLITGNVAIQDGGGIHNSGTIDELVNSDISNNQAGLGGGIFNNFTITNLFDSTISANQVSQFGGGIYNSHTINLINNSTISGNQAVNNGGGIYDSSGTLLDITHTTFSNNLADFGGAVFVSNSSTQVNINKSLFHENSGAAADCGGSISNNVSGNNNLSSKTTSDNVCNATIATGLNAASVMGLVDNGCHFTKPLANGSCAKTHALLAQSEAINFITSTFPEDQRGFTLTDGLRDVGAFEFLTIQQQCDQSNIDISSVFTKQVVNVNELTQAIICANADNTTTDSINLSDNIQLPQAIENIDTGIFHDIASKGRTGTPAITSPLIINGMGFSLMRDTNLNCGSL
jgi:predicted outer membrane repeat protein